MATTKEDMEKDLEVKPKTSRFKLARNPKPKKPKPVATQMTFFEHLAELRNRLVWSCVAVVIGTIVGWVFHEQLVQAYEDLAIPAINQIAKSGHTKPEFINLNVVHNFAIYFEVSLYAGLLLASPVLVYHILAFMAPALEPESQPGEPGYEQEVKMLKSIRRSLIFFIPLVAIFFLIGIAFAYYLILPRAIEFLLGFGADQFTTLIDVKPFISQMSKIMFWSGIVFELPIFLYLMARLRIVTWQKLAGFWKWALVLSLVTAAFITPSPDLVSQGVISIPVFGLFWLGVLFARFA
ncbi:MAG TPA: twin-arginine translocase subunit TatC [Chloroflexia bacterium]|nr:twin-arginine translocase subunit TatC [Chloroflexia bacterium]